jgi:uncharacterized RDD family membrane protein YckC
MDRRTMGSWLSGPGSLNPETAAEQDFRGQRLGLPEDGPGSVASFGRRILALFIDWIAASFIVTFASTGAYGFGSPPENTAVGQALVMGVFALEVVILTGVGGASLGQRLCRMAVPGLDGRPIGLLKALVRTALLCLVIPAVIWDRDGRGLHDKAVGSVVVITR